MFDYSKYKIHHIRLILAKKAKKLALRVKENGAFFNFLQKN